MWQRPMWYLFSGKENQIQLLHSVWPCDQVNYGLCELLCMVWEHNATDTTGVTSRGDAFPLLKCLRMHYGRNCEPFSSSNALDYRISHIQSQNFLGWYPWIPKKRPDAWTQTPISAWLDSVPIVPVWRKDHRDAIIYKNKNPLNPAVKTVLKLLTIRL